MVKQTTKPIRNNSDTSINSYNTHEFIAKFLSPTKRQVDVQTRFAKGPREEVITISYDPVTNTMTSKQVTKFDEIMDTIKAATVSCDALRGDEFSACIATAVIDDVTRLTDSKTLLTKNRDLMSSRLRNYTCEDPKMNTSVPVSSYQFTYEKQTYDVDTMLDLSHSKVWVAHDFVSEDECEILMNHGRPKLRRATVAAEDGSSIVSENRKAQQASYNMHQINPGTDPLLPLYNRILALTNKVF